jgi:aminomethyltransferase
MTSLLKTPLAEWHAAYGGRMVDFAGWSMPVQYGSIVVEHEATRRAAGLFDVSHMGRLAVQGPAAATWLESLLTRRVEDLEPGRVRYTLVTSDEGESGCTVLDDALVAREADAADGTPRFSLVVNASNRRRVIEWLERHLPATGVTLVDRTFETAMLAVQGPLAVDIVCGLCSPEDAGRIRALGTYRATTATVADRSGGGHPAAVSRTGYTGEDGLELVVPATSAVAVWDAIHAAGVPRGLAACGLGARDTLRLEAGMPLYGHELTGATDPFAIGLGFAITLDRRDGGPRDFPGATALRGMRDRLPRQVRVGLALDSKRAAREGCVVVRPGGGSVAVGTASVGTASVGTVTSGSFSPSLGHAVAMALVDRECSAVGESLEVLLRGEPVAARVVPLPLYRREPSE